MLRIIYGGEEIDGIWHGRENKELYNLYKNSNSVKVIKVQRIW